MLKNPRDQSQPRVSVLFRALDEQDNLLDEYYEAKVSVTSTGKMSIGSVWRDGWLIQRARYTTKRFTVDFSCDAWTYYSIGHHDTLKDGESYLIPKETYPLLKRRPDLLADAWMLRFPTTHDITLLVPCMEFLSRCYSSSAELRRVLVTYPWPEAERRLFATPSESVPEQEDAWSICIGRDMRNDDALLLAHLKHDAYALKCAKSLWAQLESAKPNQPVFLKAKPWWSGRTKIEVSGIELPSTGCFLALDINGVQPPKCPDIILDRANTNRTGEEDEDTRHGEAWDEAAKIYTNSWSDPLDLAQDEPPNFGTGTDEIAESGIRWLGEPPRIIPTKRARTASTRGTNNHGSTVDRVSAGERHGSDRGVGGASISSPVELESHGALRDMWEALKACVAANPGVLRELACFTFEAGCYRCDEPKLIPFRSNEPGPRGGCWTTVHDDEGGHQSGVFVARLDTHKGNVFILEIERQQWMPRDIQSDEPDPEPSIKEESFRGIIFSLDDEAGLADWVATATEELRSTEGVVKQSLLNVCPGMAEAFKHVPSDKETIPCEQTVRSALAKMDISVPLSDRTT